MATLTFKTNLNCSSCVRAVTPVLDKLEQVASWKVDTEVDEKVLTVEGEGISPGDIIQAVEKVGFEAAILA